MFSKILLQVERELFELMDIKKLYVLGLIRFSK